MPRHDFASQRLAVRGPLSSGATLALDPGQMNYLTNVLRMEAGAKLLVFNGQDGEWLAELVQPSRKIAAIRAIERLRAQPAPSPITYAFAPLKSARLDYLVQKAVEMGAGVLVPVLTRRTQVSRLKAERLQANVIEAAEQCGVLALPEIRPEIRFPEWLKALPAGQLLVFCDEDAEPADPVTLLRGHAGHQGIVVLVGPEGGFDPAEREALLARENSCRISLGPRILRADTAAVAALAVVQTALGDWRENRPPS